MIRHIIAVCLLLAGIACLAQAQVKETGAGKATSSHAYIGPGDTVPSASAWWGLRAYSLSYALGVNPYIADIVDTATGAASCTIVSKTNGDADLTSNLCVGNTVSVTTFCTVTHAAGCSVTKLYDQSGNGVDVVQATLANMPTLVFNAIGTLPSMLFVAAVPQKLSSAGGFGQTQPYTASYVANLTGAAGNRTVLSDSGGGASMQAGYFSAGNTAYLYAGNTPIFTAATVTDGQFHAVQNIAADASSASQINADGTATTPGAGLGSTGGWGANAVVFGSLFDGLICEGGVWGSAFTPTQQTNMCHNQFSYWGTPNSC